MSEYTEHEIYSFFMHIGDFSKIDVKEAQAALDLFLETIGCSRTYDAVIAEDYDIDHNLRRPFIQTRYTTAPNLNLRVSLGESRIHLPVEEKNL